MLLSSLGTSPIHPYNYWIECRRDDRDIPITIRKQRTSAARDLVDGLMTKMMASYNHRKDLPLKVYQIKTPGVLNKPKQHFYTYIYIYIIYIFPNSGLDNKKQECTSARAFSHQWTDLTSTPMAHRFSWSHINGADLTSSQWHTVGSQVRFSQGCNTNSYN